MNDTELHQDFGELKGTVSALSAEVNYLRIEVRELTAVLNQARGAKFAIFALPALVSALVAVLSFIGLKLTFPFGGN